LKISKVHSSAPAVDRAFRLKKFCKFYASLLAAFKETKFFTRKAHVHKDLHRKPFF